MIARLLSLIAEPTQPRRYVGRHRAPATVRVRRPLGLGLVLR